MKLIKKLCKEEKVKCNRHHESITTSKGKSFKLSIKTTQPETF